MKQYLIIAQDGKDPEALERRMKVRPTHFEGARQLKEKDHFILGGAILDENGNMTGSMMVVQFESEEELKSWMSIEPYITGNVWKQIEVKPFRVAQV